MRIPIIVTIFFVAAAAGIGWHNHQRLTTLQAVRGKLTEQAEARGMILDSSDGENHIRITKRPREDRVAAAKTIAADLLAYARERAESTDRSRMPDAIKQFNQLRTERVKRWLELDSKQLQIVIAEVLAAEDIRDDVRWDILNTTITRLSDDHPQEALAILADLAKRGGSRQAIGRSPEGLMGKPLEIWAKTDPAAAIHWFKDHSSAAADNPYATSIIRRLVAGTAEKDLRLALKLINELGGDPEYLGAGAFARESRTPEERISDFTILREWSAGIPDPATRERATDKCIEALVFGLSGEPADFESVTRLLDSTMLSPKEKDGVISQALLNYVDRGESGRWVEWLEKTRPPDLAKKEINDLVDRWSRTDQVAAERWLAKVPNGPTKNLAVASYVRAILQSHPDAVVDRALNLLEGEDRINVVKRICLNTPTETAEEQEALEAWAKKQGVE